MTGSSFGLVITIILLLISELSLVITTIILNPFMEPKEYASASSAASPDLSLSPSSYALEHDCSGRIDADHSDRDSLIGSWDDGMN